VVKVRREFTVSVMNEEMQKPHFAVSIPHELPRLLRDPSAIRVCGTASDMNAARSKFDKAEHVQGLQANGFDGEAIARQHLLPIVLQKCAP
jgi:hypothetical protein